MPRFKCFALLRQSGNTKKIVFDQSVVKIYDMMMMMRSRANEAPWRHGPLELDGASDEETMGP